MSLKTTCSNLISQQRPDVYAIRVNRAACTRIHLQLLQQHRQPRLQRSPFVRSGSIAGSCRAGSKQSRRSKRLSDTMIRCSSHSTMKRERENRERTKKHIARSRRNCCLRECTVVVQREGASRMSLKCCRKAHVACH